MTSNTLKRLNILFKTKKCVLVTIWGLRGIFANSKTKEKTMNLVNYA